MAADFRDHFRNGAVALDDTSAAKTNVNYEGVLVLANDTTFSTLTCPNVDDSDGALSGGTYAAGVYLPVDVSAITVSAGAVLCGYASPRRGQ